jgi:hypothetical protein
MLVHAAFRYYRHTRLFVGGPELCSTCKIANKLIPVWDKSSSWSSLIAHARTGADITGTIGTLEPAWSRRSMIEAVVAPLMMLLLGATENTYI